MTSLFHYFSLFSIFHLMESLLIPESPGIRCFSMPGAIAYACLLFPGTNHSFALRRCSWLLSGGSLSPAALSSSVVPSNLFVMGGFDFLISYRSLGSFYFILTWMFFL